jgi:hypothetical protein
LRNQVNLPLRLLFVFFNLSWFVISPS